MKAVAPSSDAREEPDTTPSAEEPGVAPARRSSRWSVRQLLEGGGWNVLQFGADLILLYTGVAAALIGAPAAGVHAGGVAVWFFPALAVAGLAARGHYSPRLEARLLDSIAGAVGVVSVVAICLIALPSLIDPEARTHSLVVRAWLFGVLFVAGGRIVVGATQRRAQAHRIVAKPTLIVGAGRVGAQVERRLRVQPELGLRPVGYIDDDPSPPELGAERRVPVLGAPSDLPRVADQTGARHVIIAFSSTPDHVLVSLVRVCDDLGLQLSFVPRLFDNVNRRVELQHMGGLPLYGLRPVNPRGWQFAVKHAIGKAIAVVLLVVLSPLMVATALAVKLTSSGPVIFRQRRVGRDGHEFDLLKFRSMREDSTSDDRAAQRAGQGRRPDGGRDSELDEEERLGPGGVEGALALTPIGRFIRRTSIDELPQLWNVVRGDMTLVGPRPERPEFVAVFEQSIGRYDDRHRVKSGVTGWAQVHGLRGNTPLVDRIEFDNYYIENWSLWLDLKVLLMTLTVPFRARE